MGIHRLAPALLGDLQEAEHLVYGKEFPVLAFFCASRSQIVVEKVHPRLYRISG
jgi:hypothetical protein